MGDNFSIIRGVKEFGVQSPLIFQEGALSIMRELSKKNLGLSGCMINNYMSCALYWRPGCVGGLAQIMEGKNRKKKQ